MGNCCGCDHREECTDAKPEVEKTEGCECTVCHCDPCECGEETEKAEEEK